MHPLHQLKIKIFADGADIAGMRSLYENPLIQGLTTNPTLMNKSGIRDYEKFAKTVLEFVKEKPISFEVFSDDFSEMKRQALKISSWQNNVFVKIPITNTLGKPSAPLIKELSHEGVQLNITALLTLKQVEDIVQSLNPNIASVISIFAGRIADTGRDPIPVMRTALSIMTPRLPKSQLLWGSAREILNIYHAESAGSHIITVPHNILNKALKIWNMDLQKLSLETVKMFDDDAKQAGFVL